MQRWWLVVLLGLFGCARGGFNAASDGSDISSGPTDTLLLDDNSSIPDAGSDGPAESCVKLDDGTPCDDRNICTSTSTCQGGVCTGPQGPSSCKVADSRDDFGDVQGGLGWWYGYWHAEIDPDASYHPTIDFEEMVHASDDSWKPADWEVNPTWCYLAEYWEHPENNPLKIPVRRWVSDVLGPAVIQVRFGKSDASGGDGTRKIVVIDGVEVWSHDVAGNDPIDVHDQITVDLQPGTLVDFLLHPIGSDSQDASEFEASIVSP